MGRVVPDVCFTPTMAQLQDPTEGAKHFEVWCIDGSVWEFKIGFGGLTKIEISSDLVTRRVPETRRVWVGTWEWEDLKDGARLSVYTPDLQTIKSEIVASVFVHRS